MHSFAGPLLFQLPQQNIISSASFTEAAVKARQNQIAGALVDVRQSALPHMPTKKLPLAAGMGAAKTHPYCHNTSITHWPACGI
jgi:hypothetical protein